MANSGFNQGQTGNASEVGAGVVKLATQAQVDARQADDGGVPLVATPDKIPGANDLPGFLAGEVITEGKAVALTNADWGIIEIDQLDEGGTPITLSNVADTDVLVFEVQIPANAEDWTQLVIKGNNQISNNWQGGTVYFTATLNGPSFATSTMPNESAGGGPARLGIGVTSLDITPYQGTTIFVHVTAAGGQINSNMVIVTSDLNNYPGAVYVGAAGFGGAYTEQVGVNVYLELGFTFGTKDQVVLASAANQRSSKMNFLGFAKNDAAIGEEVVIENNNSTTQHNQVLTPGETYYLSDTPGEISTTIGSYERIVGYAINASRLARKRGNCGGPFASGGDFGVFPGIPYAMQGTQSTTSSSSFTINGVNIQSEGAAPLLMNRGDIYIGSPAGLLDFIWAWDNGELYQ